MGKARSHVPFIRLPFSLEEGERERMRIRDRFSKRSKTNAIAQQLLREKLHFSRNQILTSMSRCLS